eukprot:scaffold40413_cov38-Tisochrysis_lutea.AAC.1
MAERRTDGQGSTFAPERTSEAKTAVIAASTPSITRRAHRSVGRRIRIGASTQPQRISMTKAAIKLSSATPFSAPRGFGSKVWRRKLMCDTKVGAPLMTTHAPRMIKQQPVEWAAHIERWRGAAGVECHASEADQAQSERHGCTQHPDGGECVGVERGKLARLVIAGCHGQRQASAAPRGEWPLRTRRREGRRRA